MATTDLEERVRDLERIVANLDQVVIDQANQSAECSTTSSQAFSSPTCTSWNLRPGTP